MSLPALQNSDDSAPLALTFTPPLAHLGEWADLPEKRRTEIRVVLPVLSRIHQLVKNDDASLEAACQVVSAASKHLMRGLSPVRLRAKYEAYANGGHRPGDTFKEGDSFLPGDWRILVAGYVGPSKQPSEFIDEVKRRANLNHLSMAEAFKQLRDAWANGEAIAGYGDLLADGTRGPGTWIDWYRRTWPTQSLPKVFPRRYPVGWSVRNLRRYGPKRGARMLFQRGLAAAKKHFPSVRRDPSALRRFEVLVMDDFELDCNCVFPGDKDNRPQIGRVAGLLMISAATREKLHWGLGQRLTRLDKQPDGTTKEVKAGISRIDVQLFLHGFFEKYGLPDYPVTILCEMDKAAASISAELQLSIETLFAGRVRIERTGIFQHKNLANGFCERGGRPWLKGQIESTFAQIWNIMGAQKGYKGNNERINGPGDLEDKIAYTKLLLGHGEENLTAAQAAVGRKHGLALEKGEARLNLPPEKIALLKLPFQTPQELERAFAWACAVSDARTDHAYLGFDKVTEYIVEEGGAPVPFTALALLTERQMLQATPVTRMESSVERAERLARTEHYTALDRSALAIFLLTPKRAKFIDSAISFKHDGKGYSFVDAEGSVLAGVQEGTEFLCFLNPAAPDQLHITALDGSRTGTLIRFGGKRGAVPFGDKVAGAQVAALQATLINRTIAENRMLHADQERENAEAKIDNAAIVAAHKAETITLPIAQKIGLAAGAHAQAAVEKKQADSEAAREIADREKSAAARRAAVDADLADYL